jgi:hypothetical protein
MYHKDSRKDWIGGIVTATLGAGVVTSFAISRGQHPLLALGITAIAVTATLMIDHYLPKN